MTDYEANAKISAMIADKNFGGAWQVAITAYGEMNYTEFLKRFVW